MAQLDGREVKAFPSPALLLHLGQQKPGVQEHEVGINVSNGYGRFTCGRGILSH